MEADRIQTMRISQPDRVPCIHPTATVNGDVQLEEGATIGPYCVVEGRVKIGVGTKVLAHSVVQGTTFIGAGCKDVLRFGAVIHSAHKGYNAIGCSRAGLNEQTIHALRGAFREIHSHRSARRAALVLQIRNSCLASPELCELIDFIDSSRRGIQPSASTSSSTNAKEAYSLYR